MKFDDQPSNNVFELARGVWHAQTTRINDGKPERIRLPAKIRGPRIHLRAGELGLLPRAAESRRPNVQGTVDQDDVERSKTDWRRSVEDEARASLAVQDGDSNGRRKSVQACEPLGGRGGLPAFTASMVPFHDIGRRDANGIEVKALHARERTSVERVDDRGLTGAGSTGDDKDAIPSAHACLALAEARRE